MALPKLNTVTYELEMPSTQETLKYRPFLVKEQKVLMIAQESEDEAAVQNAIADVIKSCTFEKVDPWTMPSFDLEYIFLNIRGKSVGDVLDLTITCPDDNETTVPVKVDIQKINVQVDENHTNILELSEDIKLIMKYPTMKDISKITNSNKGDTQQLFEIIKTCISEIHSGEEIFHSADISVKDLDEFLGDLQPQHLDTINTYFDTMPRLYHMIKVENPVTGVESEVELSGFDDFFD